MEKNQKVIAKASEIINSKKDYVGDGMEGYVTFTTIDDEGYPSSSTMSISKADGVKWMTFISHLSSDRAKRIAKCNRVCVCLNSSKYHISLVGTVETLTDIESKKESWQETMREYWSKGPEEPDYCVLRFTTQRYNIYIVDGDLEAQGKL